MELLNQVSSKMDNAKNVMSLQGLNDLRQQAREDQKAALRPVAEQFEALFLQQVLKESRKVSFDDGWLDGKEADTYKEWYDQQLAQDLSSKGSLGFADKIVEQLAPQIGLQAKSIEEAEALMQFNKSSVVESAKTQPLEPSLPDTQSALQARPFLK